MATLEQEIQKRKTFGIIAHPDAGKTTLTEKLLLFGGAIQEAGAVKSNKIKKGATSDFMEIERQRGISVATSVLAFEYKGKKINILDTPGHKDFAEDTYRTLTAVDSAIVVIDVAKGVEEQTVKLVEVCRMRNIPMLVFINKMDRDGKNRFDLLEEIEKELKEMTQVRKMLEYLHENQNLKNFLQIISNFKNEKFSLKDDEKSPFTKCQSILNFAKISSKKSKDSLLTYLLKVNKFLMFSRLNFFFLENISTRFSSS